jgi:hypothetical protein
MSGSAQEEADWLGVGDITYSGSYNHYYQHGDIGFTYTYPYEYRYFYSYDPWWTVNVHGIKHYNYYYSSYGYPMVFYYGGTYFR